MVTTNLSNQEKLNLYFESKEKYYNDGNSSLTDSEFDQLENELRNLNLLNDSNEVVGYTSLHNKIKHWNPMLSLSKLQVNEESDEEFRAILKKIAEYDNSVIVE